jgi:hypothetical protein
MTGLAAGLAMFRRDSNRAIARSRQRPSAESLVTVRAAINYRISRDTDGELLGHDRIDRPASFETLEARGSRVAEGKCAHVEGQSVHKV